MENRNRVPSDQEVVNWGKQHPDIVRVNNHVAAEVLRAQEKIAQSKKN